MTNSKKKSKSKKKRNQKKNREIVLKLVELEKSDRSSQVFSRVSFSKDSISPPMLKGKGEKPFGVICEKLKKAGGSVSG